MYRREKPLSEVPGGSYGEKRDSDSDDSDVGILDDRDSDDFKSNVDDKVEEKEENEKKKLTRTSLYYTLQMEMSEHATATFPRRIKGFYSKRF